MMPRVIVVLVLVLLSSPVLLMAKEARPLAEDPAIEARMLALATELRCLVCQNQSLAGSDSDFANDLRREIRIMLKEGKSDQEIRDFLVQRFGDFILFKPPVQSNTLPLWYGPAVLLLVGGVVLILVLRRRVKQGVNFAPLSPADHQRAEALLREQDNDGTESRRKEEPQA